MANGESCPNFGQFFASAAQDDGKTLAVPKMGPRAEDAFARLGRRRGDGRIRPWRTRWQFDPEGSGCRHGDAERPNGGFERQPSRLYRSRIATLRRRARPRHRLGWAFEG